MPSRLMLCALFVPLLFSPPAGFAQPDFEEDADYPPGLLAVYSAGDRTIERIDPDVAFDWKDAAPDARLPAGPFTAKWTGQLLVRVAGNYRLHLHLAGDATVRVNGETVLTGSLPTPGWVSGREFTLDFGEQELEIEYRKTGPSARIQLYWSSDAFPLEPVPAALLFRDEPHVHAARIEYGRELYDSHRCNRCHQRENEALSPPGPALGHASMSLDREWMIGWLQNPQSQEKHARMPQFGFDQDEAEAVTAFLLSLQKKSPEFPPVAANAKAARKGQVLFRSLGCLACHTHGDEGKNPAWGGGDLTHIGRKRSSGWLLAWLKNPKNLNADHRMPTFALSDAEAKELATFLAGSDTAAANKPVDATDKVTASEKDQIARGRALVEAARCAACHNIPGVKTSLTGIPSLAKFRDGEGKSCFEAPPDRRKWRPGYASLDAESLRAYLKSRAVPLSRESEYDHGRRVLAQNNCLACHSRDNVGGIASIAGAIAQTDPDLKGESEAMVPPSLNAVGDKLLDPYLKTAVSGEQRGRRLPWLHVRMPRFAHAQEDHKALVAYLIHHDRIPEEAPQSVAAPATKPSSEASQEERSEILLAGHTLVGGKGWSCVACHQVGKFTPRNVALGTKGSDLRTLSERMRREFFLRWVRSPLRIVPDMEMPSYDKPVAQVLGGDLFRQHAAIWDALLDPQFTVPADPSVVEQYFVVAPGGAARVVRDVFTLPHPEKEEFVARAFAIGLANQHNLLIDLDRMTLREWWVGDFARQRAQGKSWYWDQAGIPVATGLGTVSDFGLRSTTKPDQPVIQPSRIHGKVGTLQSYRPSGSGVELQYVIDFVVEGKPHSIAVTEVITPQEATTAALPGWRRAIAVRDVPAGHEVVFARQPLQAALGSIAFQSVEPAKAVWTKSLAQSADGKSTSIEFCVLPEASGSRKYSGIFDYRASARPNSLPEKPVEATPIEVERVTTVPGYDGIRLPIDRSIMPTAITWTTDGTLAFTSLKGHVYLVRDTDGDGIEDQLQLFEEGLAAPYGLIADGNDLIVAHKPELLRLRDTDGDGRADVREVIATGWGYCDNYHDWTCGIVRDSQGNLYVGLGSDYAQPKRDRQTTRWRGKVLRIAPDGTITPMGHAFRYPTGLAITSDDQVFVTDNQGVQNTFNEINHLIEGASYGVPALDEADPPEGPRAPAIQVPHPWTRSVNGIFFLEGPGVNAPKAFGPFAGHGIGCEYDTRFLIRFTLDRVGDTFQGATYPFSLQDTERATEGFEGTLCGAVSPKGEIYVGSIHDSGWLGGLNVGSIVRLKPNGSLPMGIRALRAEPQGFRVEFTGPIDPARASAVDAYSISGYRRIWAGGYATPDSDRHKVQVTKAEVSADRLSVRLTVDRLQEGFVYEVTCSQIAENPETVLWPRTAHYTLNRVPERSAVAAETSR